MITRKTVLYRKEDLDRALTQMDLAVKRLELEKNNFKDCQHTYREAEVEYVLENLLLWNRKGQLESKDIDLYLTHCINCLHGNIDGTVVEMQKEKLKDGKHTD